MQLSARTLAGTFRRTPRPALCEQSGRWTYALRPWVTARRDAHLILAQTLALQANRVCERSRSVTGRLRLVHQATATWGWESLSQFTRRVAQKEGATMASKKKATKKNAHPVHGRYCVLRGYRIGVRCGLVTGECTIGDVTFLVVADSRRLQYQKYVSANGTLDSVSIHGLATGSIVSEAQPIPHLVDARDVCEIKPCTPKAESILRGYPHA